MILVTGGTGFVGSHLVERLRQEGRPVRCLVRDPSRAGHLRERGVELVAGDITEPTSLGPALRGVEAVVHLVAIIREQGDRTFQKVNVEGTGNVVGAAKAAGVRRFVHMSALGAVDDPRYRYIYSKWQAEEIVRKSGLDWTIFRPSVIYGPGFGFFDRLWQSVKLSPPPIVPVPGSGKTRFQPIWVGDVATCIVKAVDDPSTAGKLYEIGGPEHLTFEQMLDGVMKVRGVRRLKVKVPLFLMRPVVPLMGLVLRDPPVSSVELKQLDVDNVTAIDSVVKNFGFQPTPFEQGIQYFKAG